MGEDVTLAADAPAPERISRNPLSERLLFVRARSGVGTHTRDDLVERYMGLARSCARRYARGSEPIEDLEQVAYFALVKAVDRYDPEQGTTFSTFAVPTIVGELKRHFRDRSWAVRPPRSLQENWLKVERAQKKLSSQDGRQPTVSELAQATALGEEDVLEALQARTGLSASSLDKPVTTREGDGESLGEMLGTRDDGFERAEDRATLGSLVSCLSERDRKVLHLRFEQDMTQAEIAEIIGVSQMQISRIIRASLLRLRAAAQA